MSSPHFMEWGSFAPQYLSPAPTRRTGRKWILEGEIAGKIIGDKVYVDLSRFLANSTEARPVDPQLYKMLHG